MFCQKCGTQLNDDSSFCNSCGSPQVIEKVIETVHIANELEDKKTLLLTLQEILVYVKTSDATLSNRG